MRDLIRTKTEGIPARGVVFLTMWALWVVLTYGYLIATEVVA